MKYEHTYTLVMWLEMRIWLAPGSGGMIVDGCRDSDAISRQAQIHNIMNKTIKMRKFFEQQCSQARARDMFVFRLKTFFQLFCFLPQ